MLLLLKVLLNKYKPYNHDKFNENIVKNHIPYFFFVKQVKPQNHKTRNTVNIQLYFQKWFPFHLKHDW